MKNDKPDYVSTIDAGHEVHVPWDRYDYIGVAGCVQYMDRFGQMDAQLKEYGCLSARWHFDFPSPFRDSLYRIVRKSDKLIKKPATFALTMNHYYHVKTAYHMGCERALFMEDDAFFLRDKVLMADIMRSVPDDADVAMYDWSAFDWRNQERIAAALSKRDRCGGHWVKANDVPLVYFSMVGLNRKAMKWLIDKLEQGAFAPGGGMQDIDFFFRPGMNSGINVYAAFPRAAVQGNTGVSVHAKNKPYGNTISKDSYVDRGNAANHSLAPQQERAEMINNGKVEDDASYGIVDNVQPDAEDAVDAVFVIGTGSRNGNEELKYALRNLDAHCKFIRNVYICGECPAWVDKSEVIHLPWPDRFRHAKDSNIIDKLRHACEAPGIAKRVLFCSDDQFQTRACSWDDFSPRYLRRYDPNDKWYVEKHRVWHTRLRKTLDRDRKRRESCGLDPRNVFYYQPHIWMPIDRDKFIEYAKWCDYEHRDDTIIASGYFNYADATGRKDFDHVFLRAGSASFPTMTHVAYADSTYGTAMRFLKKLFPSPCRFEIGGKKAMAQGDSSHADAIKYSIAKRICS